jgi:hypothetical protein
LLFIIESLRGSAKHHSPRDAVFRREIPFPRASSYCLSRLFLINSSKQILVASRRLEVVIHPTYVSRDLGLQIGEFLSFSLPSTLASVPIVATEAARLCATRSD